MAVAHWSGYGETEKPDVEMQMNRAAMEDIVNGLNDLPEGVYVRHYEANEGRFPNSQNTDADVFPFEENNR